MIPTEILIQYDKCCLTLDLPIFFKVSTITNIRKVFKLLDGRPYQNETAFKILDLFFPEWEQGLKGQLDRTGAELTAAKQDVEEKRRTLATLGSTVDEKIEHTKAVFLRAKKAVKQGRLPPEKLVMYQTALDMATFPKTDYRQAVETVKRLEKKVKQVKATVERCSVVIATYNKKTRLRKPIKGD